MNNKCKPDIFEATYSPAPMVEAQQPAPSAAAAGEVPLPLLVRDIAADLGVTPVQVCLALVELGFGHLSVNMAITPEMAEKLREHFAAPTPQADSQPAPAVGYPPLPRVGAIGYASVVDIDSYAKTLTIGPHLPGVRDIALWTTDQMRAYVDADRAARAPADSGAAPAYSIDADPQGIRARVADAITGALAFGAQGANPPPTGHWLVPFWEQAREEASHNRPVSSDTLYLLRRLLSNQHTLTSAEFREELTKIVGEATHAADSVLEDAALPAIDRAFLERTLSAMEGVLDVADRKTDEFDALRCCVVDLTVALFRPVSRGQGGAT